jgi:hypothetical protein
MFPERINQGGKTCPDMWATLSHRLGPEEIKGEKKRMSVSTVILCFPGHHAVSFSAIPCLPHEKTNTLSNNYISYFAA